MTNRILATVAGFVVGGLLVVGFVAWLVFDDESSGTERGASIDKIVGAPAEWSERRVEVSGRVVSVYPTAFTIGTRDAELLVVAADRSNGDGPIGPGDIGSRLRVRGVVERFDEQAELVPGGENEPHEGDAMLRADAIERVTEDA